MSIDFDTSGKKSRADGGKPLSQETDVYGTEHVADCQFTKLSPSGSATGFERAYQMYRSRVYFKCLHMVGNEAEAEDLTQEVFLQLFRKIDSFRGESAFSTWLYRLAINVVLMRLRRKSLLTSSLEEVIELKEGTFSRQQFLGVCDSTLTTAIDRLSLERAVSQMPAGYKQIFLLHYVEGYGHREIARMLGLSIGTSKSQLYKARLRLRQLLRGERSARWQERISRRLQHVFQTASRKSGRSRLSFAGSCRLSGRVERSLPLPALSAGSGRSDGPSKYKELLGKKSGGTYGTAGR